MKFNRFNRRKSRHTDARCMAQQQLRFERLEDRRLLVGEPELLKDIFVGSEGSNIRSFVEVGSVAYFSADDGVHGNELWKSDGTTAGTTLVKDIYPGIRTSSPQNLTNVNGTLFFTAGNPAQGFELWKSDGTESGTVLVKDIFVGDNSSLPDDLTNVNGTLFFRADDGLRGHELWRSNGTEAGTVRVRDINPGVNGSFPEHLVNVNGTLFFTARDTTSGKELWKTNGTANSTVQVADLKPGAGNYFIEELTNVNGTLFFSSNNATGSYALWKSSGTAASTIKVKEFFANSGGSPPIYLTNVNGTLFFQARTDAGGRELWKSDGTSAGTSQVKDTSPGDTGPFVTNLTAVGRTLFFIVANPAFSFDLWKSDGTSAGTERVARIGVGIPSIPPSSLTNVDGILYFTTFNMAGEELWFSDGTLAGTKLVQDLQPGAIGSSPAGLTNVAGNLFFAANDGARGSEPWFLDPPKTLSIGATSANKPEGNSGSTPFTFTVTRAGSQVGAITANYAVTGIGANRATANDFVGNVFPSGTITFAPGQTTRLITIPVRGEVIGEANEGFRVTLVAASGGATIVTPTANGLIRNDDTQLAIAATNANRNELDGGTTLFTFTVTRTGSPVNTTTVNYAVTGVGVSPATASDFIGGMLPSGTVTFAAGETTKVITINVRGDLIAEANERFNVTLINASTDATITTAIAAGLIRNDDTSVSIAATSSNRLEGNTTNSAYTFTITRTGVLTSSSTVKYAASGSGLNPATADDFFGNAFASGQVTFAAGQTTKVITILVRGDLIVEPDEGFMVRLSDATGASITTGIAGRLILTDDFGVID